MKIARTIVAAVIAFFVLAIGAVAFRYVINALGSLMLFGFADSERAFYDLDSAANILGFIGAVYVASACSTGSGARCAGSPINPRPVATSVPGP
jgi:uncharacterized membrane protein required for colicin V production